MHQSMIDPFLRTLRQQFEDLKRFRIDSHYVSSRLMYWFRLICNDRFFSRGSSWTGWTGLRKLGVYSISWDIKNYSSSTYIFILIQNSVLIHVFPLHSDFLGNEWWLRLLLLVILFCWMLLDFSWLLDRLFLGKEGWFCLAIWLKSPVRFIFSNIFSLWCFNIGSHTFKV